MSDVIKRLKELMHEKNLKQTDLASIANVTTQAANNWFVRGKISTDSAKKICLHTGYSLEWLLTGKFLKKTTLKVNNLEINNNLPNNINKSYIVRSIKYNNEIANMTMDCKDNVIAIEFDKEYAKNAFDGLPAEQIMFSSFVPDTMEETIKKGSTVFLDTKTNKFVGAGIYMFAFNGFPHLNRLQMRGDHIVVISDNKRYNDWEIKIDDFDKIIFAGRVVGYYPPFIML